jgi:hypothetical protein
MPNLDNRKRLHKCSLPFHGTPYVKTLENISDREAVFNQLRYLMATYPLMILVAITKPIMRSQSQKTNGGSSNYLSAGF